MHANFESRSSRKKKKLKNFGRGSVLNETSVGMVGDVADLEEIWIAVIEAPDHREDGVRMSTEVRQLDVKLTRTFLRIAEMRDHVAFRRLDDDRGHWAGPDRNLKDLIAASTENQYQDRGLDHFPLALNLAGDLIIELRLENDLGRVIGIIVEIVENIALIGEIMIVVDQLVLMQVQAHLLPGGIGIEDIRPQLRADH